MKTVEHLVLGLILVAGLGLMGCGGDDDGGGEGGTASMGGTPNTGGASMGGDSGGGAPTTADVFARLGPSCGPCHAATAEAGVAYFASEAAFQTLVVDEFVVAGDPDGSLLVQQLEGTAMGGTYTQMPLGVKFVDMPDTQISMDEIRAWIAAL